MVVLQWFIYDIIEVIEVDTIEVFVRIIFWKEIPDIEVDFEVLQAEFAREDLLSRCFS